MKMIKAALIVVLIQILFAAASFAAEPLTLTECIKTALDKHPDLIAAKSKIESEKAAVGEAAADGNLQAGVSAYYVRSGGSSAENAGNYNTAVTLEQSVYDWGKRGLSITAAKINTDAAKADYLQARDQVIADVRSAYYGLNRSLRQQKVAQTRYENYRKRLSWAKSYYEAGTKAKIEVTKAESDYASSKLALVTTQSSAEQMRAQLASAMGEPLLKVDNVEDALDFKDWDIGADDAVKKAVSNRPELAAQRKRVDYARTTLALEKKGLAPDLSASAGYGLYGNAPFDDNEWSAKLSMNIPIIDGGLTKSRIEGAQADLVTANAEMESLSNSVILEVRKAWQSLREAKEALTASMEAERFAKETYDLAEGRYKAGVGDSLEISDAIESYAAAQAETVLSLYNCKEAQLDLEKAMGGLDNESK
jgi:outer membrane protein TolC